jgi:hypothetical protein
MEHHIHSGYEARFSALEAIVATLSDVTTALTDLNNNLSALTAQVNAAVSAVQAGAGAVTPAELDPVVQGLQAASQSLATLTSDLTAALAPPAAG